MKEIKLNGDQKYLFWVDIDGVLYDFVGQFETVLGGKDIAPDCYSLEEMFGIDTATVEGIFKEREAELYGMGEPIRWSANALWQISKMGHEIIYISNRAESAYDITKEWLKD